MEYEQLIRDYIAAIEQGAVGEDLARYFTPDVVQEEFPNRLLPEGAVRDLDAVLSGAVRGQQVLRKQELEIHSIIHQRNLVAVEVTWIGTLAVSIGSLSPGDQMRARFCMILEIEGSKIRRQRNYDCFFPF